MTSSTASIGTILSSFVNGNDSRIKLLVATEFSPNASGGGPAVVRQMLRDWPAEDLFWWSCLPEREARFGQRVKAVFCAAIPSKLMPQRRMSRVKSAVLDRCWAPLAAAHLGRTIRRVQPDAVWVIPHNWAILPLAAVLPTAGTGFHVSMHDYVDVHGQSQKFGASQCKRMALLADQIYLGATTRDAISFPMMEDLKARTHAGAANLIRAGLEVEDFRELEAERPAIPSEVRIAYAGSILVPKEFALFVKALREIRPGLPRPVRLDLFGAHSYAAEAWFDAGWMREHGNLPEPELRTALRGCTWGFAPMALTDDDPRYNRFSLPTKFITYLAAGLPVIALGHPASSVMRMARQYGVGIASEAESVEALAGDLRGPLSESSPLTRYAGEIIRCARTEFDANRMRALLKNCFARGAEATRAFNAR